MFNFIKNNKYFLVFFTIFIIAIFSILSNIFSNKNQEIFFDYPKWNINFSDIEIDKNNFYIKQRFDKEYLNVSYNLYQFFLYAKRMPLYMPHIEKKLKEYELPDDLKYLPIAESALRDDAISSVWAAWIWQFMPETAREYWLIVNENIDERYNFEKSTESALKYLKYLNKKFKDWPLAIASYNRWQNAISKALKEQNVDNYFDLVLNDETSRYFFRILAIKYVILDYETKKDKIDKVIGWTYEPINYNYIDINYEIDDLKIWSKDNNYKYKDIKTLNPWILWDYLPKGERKIKIIK